MNDIENKLVERSLRKFINELTNEPLKDKKSAIWPLKLCVCLSTHSDHTPSMVWQWFIFLVCAKTKCKLLGKECTKLKLKSLTQDRKLQEELFYQSFSITHCKSITLSSCWNLNTNSFALFKLILHCREIL